MARHGSGSPFSRGNTKLDSFLRRNTDQGVYERIRFSEPCVVISESINKAYMHVVLSDERVLLTEYAPRTLTTALSFRRVRDIELVNDLPDFLQGKHRELCQHIRITYVTQEPVRRRSLWRTNGQRPRPPPAHPPSHPSSRRPPIARTFAGCPAHSKNETEIRMLASARVETLSLGRLPQPPPQPPPRLSSPADTHSSPVSPLTPRLQLANGDQVSRGIGSVLSRLLRRDRACGREERAAELHLYAVSRASRLYLHLQSSWNSFVIRSTLLLDPLYRGRCRALSEVVSREKTAQRFAQLSSELLQEEVSVERLYLLLQELRAAAQRSIALSRLFWKSRDVCVFLVHTLEESLHGCGGARGVYTADQLLLSTLIVQTLAIMFRETEGEPARLDLLSAENGALASRLLLLLCDPETQKQGRDCEALLQEYLDASCSLLFELLLLGHEASRCSPAHNLLSVSWILRVLQPHPHLSSFLGYQVKQVVLVLSDLREPPLSPAQAVLLYQRCRLLLACLQYNNQLSQHLRSRFREEFRYFVKPSCAEEKLPPHYPISQPTVRLVEELLNLNR